MAINRTTPTSGPMSGTDFATNVNEEVAALWRISAEPLQNVGGTADVITADPLVTTTGGFAAYAAGNKFSFIAAATNTAAVTINIGGLGAKAIVTAANSALAAGQIISGTQYIIEYDGTSFRLVQAVIDLGAAIAAAPEKTALVAADKFALADSEDSNSLAYIEKSDLAAALNVGLTLIAEDEPTTDVSEITQTGLSAYRDITVAFALHKNNSGASVLISGRVSGGTWRDMITITNSNDAVIGEFRIRNFGRDNNMKLISGIRSNPAGNIDRSDALHSGTTVGYAGYSSYDEQWDEIKVSVSTSTIEGDTADRRAWVGYYGEGVGD